MERRCLFVVTDGHEPAVHRLAERLGLIAPFEVRAASAEQLEAPGGLSAVEGMREHCVLVALPAGQRQLQARLAAALERPLRAPFGNFLWMYFDSPDLGSEDVRSGRESCVVVRDPDDGLHVALYAMRLFNEMLTAAQLATYVGDTVQELLLADRLRRKNEEVERLNRELEVMSRTDPLTGVLNRRAILEVLSREVARVQRVLHRARVNPIENPLRQRDTLSVVMFDLDHFKNINDVHGHAAGDGALKAFTGLVTADGFLRRSDALGRLGGEEFLLVLPETLASDAVVCAERVRAGLRTCVFPESKSGPLAVTVSAGISAFDPTDTDFEAVVRRADEALYEAKRRGRDQVVVHASPKG